MTKVDTENKYTLSEIDLENPKNAHDFQITLVGNNKKVLEIGTASGYIAKILSERGCKITGIEENPTLADSAKEFTEKIIVGDIETLDLTKNLGNEKYDVILLGDVLEHLKHPEKLLKKLHDFLNDDGYLVCSIPNISHILIRLKLLNGEFNYESTGLMDEDHLKFYTLKTIISMLAKGKFKIQKLCKVKQEFHLIHRNDIDSSKIPQVLVDCIVNDPESLTYQYVFTAVPSSNYTASSSFKEDTLKKYPTEYLNDIIRDKYINSHDLDNSQIKIKKKIVAIHHYESAIKEKDTVIHTLEGAVKEKDVVMKTLEGAVKEKDAHIEKIIREKDVVMKTLEGAVKEKDAHIEKIIREKDAHIEKVIKAKDAHIEKIIREKDAQLNEIESIFFMKMLRKYDKFLGKRR